MALSEYEQQVLRLKRWNKSVMLFTAGLVILLMVIVVGYGYYLQHETSDQLTAIKTELINQQTEHKKTTEENLRLNKSQICILSIPANSRTQLDIDNCLMKYRAKLNE